MKELSAKQAKNNFREPMDRAQREPVTINKHGRPYAVMISIEDYKELKLQGLREKIKAGEDKLDRGEHADYSFEKLMSQIDTEFEN